ncbi:hypothetical protein [Yinghuangia sp. YIM S10712]|uniref:hypothetical protein n=1 Tax=Yinghuangia sp. YIM S10712 TaxID=3436930 RepID=UPI003F532673
MRGTIADADPASAGLAYEGPARRSCAAGVAWPIRFASDAASDSSAISRAEALRM